MSLSQTGAPCLTCVHGSICPFRDEYMKFYTHRDQVMCKTNDHSMGDDLNAVDPSLAVTVYVEHRYLNGPALDQLYQDLGLGGPSYCCLVPQNRCPLSRVGAGECFHKNYYDSPILSKWNAPLGYISPLCQPVPERWEPNKFLPQRRPLPDFCNSCAIAKGVKPGAAAELVGTTYSTFQVTQLETLKDTELDLTTIPIPSMLHAGYARSYLHGTTIHIDDESTRVICYYDWQGPSSSESEKPTPDMTENEITEAGMRTRLQILSGDAALTYTSFLKKIEDRIPLTVRKFKVVSGMDRPTYGKNAGETLCYRKGLALNPITNEQDQSYVPTLYDGKEDVIVKVGDTTPPLINIEAVEGDLVTLEIIVPAGYVLAINLMCSFGPIPAKVSCEPAYVNDKEAKIWMTFVVPHSDANVETLQFATYYVGRDPNLAPEPLDFVGIGTKDSHEIAWARNKTVFATAIDLTKYSTAETYAAPRLFNHETTPHSPAQYDTLLPPTSLIAHPFLSLVGYVKEELRIDGRFEPGVEKAVGDETDVDAIWFSHDAFLPKSYEGEDVYTALWKMTNPIVFVRMRKALREVTEDEMHRIGAAREDVDDLRVVAMEEWDPDAARIQPLSKVETTFSLENPMGKLQDTIKELIDSSLVQSHLVVLPSETTRVEVYWDAESRQFLAQLWKVAPVEEPEPEPDPEPGETEPDEELQVTNEEMDPGDSDPSPDHYQLVPIGENPIPLVDLEKQNELLAPGLYKAILLCVPNYTAHVVDFDPDTGAEGEIVPVLFEVKPIDITAMLHYHGTISCNSNCSHLTLTTVDFHGLLDEHALALNGDPEDPRLGLTMVEETLPPLEPALESAISCHCTKFESVLTGEWAPFYNLTDVDNEIYENVIIDGYLTHKDFATPIPVTESLVRSDTYRVLRGMANDIHLMVPAEGLITDVLMVTFPDEGNSDAIVLAHPEDGHMVFDPSAQTLRDGCTVIIRNGDVEDELIVTVITNRDIRFVMKMEHIDESVRVCKRCDGYIDTSVEPYTDYLEWVPDCKKYEPNKSVIL